MEWQPIETAPAEGVVLVKTDRGHVHEVVCEPDGFYERLMPYEVSFATMPFNPVAWMPLPPPPPQEPA